MENSEENKSEEKKSYFIHWLLGGAVGVFISVTLLFFYINKWTLPIVNDENNTLSNLGTIGDYFGGLINPLLGFVSFCALLYTIRIQMKSLAKQSEELELTREELRATKEELERSALAQEQSSAIFKQQQFETTFFSLLGYLDLSISQAFEPEKRQYNELILFSIGRTHEKYRELKRKSEKIENVMNIVRRDISEIKQNHINRFYSLIMLVIEILSFIDRSTLPKEMYITLFKAKLNSDILQILFISFLDDNQPFMPNGKILIEKYSVFENMDFSYPNNRDVIIFLFYLLKDKYSENAFLNNRSLEKIPVKNEFSEFKRAYYNHAN